MIYYSIYCTETEAIWPAPVGEIRPYFEGKWRIRMFDRILCPSGFTGTLTECVAHLSRWFHGRLVERGADDDDAAATALNPSHPSLRLHPSANIPVTTPVTTPQSPVTVTDKVTDR